MQIPKGTWRRKETLTKTKADVTGGITFIKRMEVRGEKHSGGTERSVQPLQKQLLINIP